MKKCPFCAEQIQDDAVKCRFCGEFLDKAKAPQQKAPWYFSLTGLIIAFFCVGPFMLPLVWIHPKMKLPSKLILTGIIAWVSWVTGKALIVAFGHLKEYFQLLQGIY